MITLDMELNYVRTRIYGDVIFFEFGNALDEYTPAYGVYIDGAFFIFDYYDYSPDNLHDAVSIFEEKGKSCLRPCSEKYHGRSLQKLTNKN